MKAPGPPVELVTSRAFYDAIAPSYANISISRAPYLNAIDNLVIDMAKSIEVDRYLDIGCGDGRRTLKIASAIDATSTLGIDESAKMLANAGGVRTECMSVAEMAVSEDFDVVTALWNVIGHVPQRQRRDVFAVIGRHLRRGGLFMVDVNNRYNLSAYGQEIVTKNKAVDKDGEGAGDVVATHNVDGASYSTIGHVFHPTEIDHIIETTPRLKIKEKLFVDYSNGENVSSPDEGQIFYVITKA